MYKNKPKLIIGISIFLVFFVIICLAKNISNNKIVEQEQKPRIARKEKFWPYKDPKDLQPEGTWKKKSEKKKHPDLAKVKKLWIRVSLKGDRTYIMSGKKPIYTMLSTGGLYHKGKSDTPTGTFHIQEERGQEFYNYELNEGARYYVSWKNHGVYLFHSVPTKANGKIDLKEAKKLGKTQGSHGCVRLSLPDAEWLMNTVPYGTKVVIKNN